MWLLLTCLASLSALLLLDFMQVKGARGLLKPFVQDSVADYSCYCVITLGSVRRQTQALKGTAAPQWNEVFGFTVGQV